MLLDRNGLKELSKRTQNLNQPKKTKAKVTKSENIQNSILFETQLNEPELALRTSLPFPCICNKFSDVFSKNPTRNIFWDHNASIFGLHGNITKTSRTKSKNCTFNFDFKWKHVLYYIIIFLLSNAFAEPMLQSLSSPQLQKNFLFEPISFISLDSKQKSNDVDYFLNRRGVMPWHVRKKTTRSLVKRNIQRSKLLASQHNKPQVLVTKAGFYVQITKKGKVRGTRKLTPYSFLKFTSVQTGVLVIRGLKAGRYLAMDKKGRLVGLKKYSNDCRFYEKLVENNFFVYYQNVRYKKKKRTLMRQVYMAFDQKGKPKRGKKIQRNDSAAHFQKLLSKKPSTARRKPRLRLKKRLRRKNVPNT